MKYTLKRFAPISLLVFASCASPDVKGRGVLTGSNSILIGSLVFVVSAIALIVGLALVDRMVRSRRELASADIEETAEPDAEPVIAGIRIGATPPPRWLYGAYVLLPAFALLYLFNVADLAPKKSAATPAPEATGHAAPELIANKVQFDTDVITIPSAEPIFELPFNNKDSIQHNLAIYTSEAATEEIFKGEIIGTKKITYEIPVPPVGTYYFRCDLHPGMNGTVNVV